MNGQSDGAHPSRTTARLKLFQPTEMTVAGTTTRVHLLNLSEGGALIDTPVPPVSGACVQVRCGPGWQTATVAWVAGRRFGVTFRSPVPAADVARIIADQEAQIAAAARRAEAEVA